MLITITLTIKIRHSSTRFDRTRRYLGEQERQKLRASAEKWPCGKNAAEGRSINVREVRNEQKSRCRKEDE